MSGKQQTQQWHTRVEYYSHLSTQLDAPDAFLHFSTSLFLIPWYPLCRILCFLSLTTNANAERGGAAAEICWWLDRGVCDQLLRGCVGARGGLRVRGMGQHHQLRAAGQYFRPFRQVLSVPAPRRPVASGTIIIHGPEPIYALHF